MAISSLKLGIAVLGASLGSILATPFALAATPTIEEGTLKVGMDITYPPFEYYEGDEVKGFDADLSRLLAKEMGAKATFENVKLANLIMGLNGRRFDTIISGMYIIPERLKVTQALPYAKTGAAILARADTNPAPTRPEDLCGKRVGLQQGTTWVAELTKLSDSYCKENNKEAITVQEFSSAPEATQALMSRNVDAQMEILGAALMIAKNTRGKVNVTTDDLVYPQTLGIFISRNNQPMFDAMKEALDKAQASGELGKLLDKYGLTPASSN